jgi:uncharacterized protein (DUF427 family)
MRMSRETDDVESVWDYPRPPALERSARRVRVELGGEMLADSQNAWRVLETSHPPTIYVPLDDVRSDLLAPSQARVTICEFKGQARYFDAVVGSRRVAAVGWTYPDPTPAFAALKDCICFYPSRVDAAWLDDEPVQAQESDFYGGWITADIHGPFKGPPGTLGW